MTTDQTSILLSSLSQDIENLNHRMSFFEMMLSQVIEALAAAQIITLERDGDNTAAAAEEEAAEEPESRIILP